MTNIYGGTASSLESSRRLLFGVLPYCVVLFALVQFWTVQGAEQGLGKIDLASYEEGLDYLDHHDDLKTSDSFTKSTANIYKSSSADDDASIINDIKSSGNAVEETDAVTAAGAELGTQIVPEVVKVAAAVAGVMGSSAMGGACCGCCMQKGKSGAGCCNWCCKCCDATLDTCCPCCDEKCCHKGCKSCEKNCHCCKGCCVGCPECCGCDPDCGCCRRCRACCPCCCKKDEECHVEGHGPECPPEHPHDDAKHASKKGHPGGHDAEHGLPKGYMY